MKKTPKAVTRPGTITAPSVPVQCRYFDIRMKRGMMPSWVGIAIVTMTPTRRPLRPRKRSFAKAKPARVEKNTTETVMVPEMMRLLSSAFAKSTVSKAFATFVRKFGPGMSAIGCRLMSEAWRLPMTNDHQSGNAAPATTAISSA